MKWQLALPLLCGFLARSARGVEIVSPSTTTAAHTSATAASAKVTDGGTTAEAPSSTTGKRLTYEDVVTINPNATPDEMFPADASQYIFVEPPRSAFRTPQPGNQASGQPEVSAAEDGGMSEEEEEEKLMADVKAVLAKLEAQAALKKKERAKRKMEQKKKSTTVASAPKNHHQE